MDENKRKTKTSIKGTIGFLTLVAMGGGCTEERPYEYLLKETNIDKSLIDQNADYVYLASQADSPRSVGATRPHWVGQEKIVRFRFTETALEVYGIEADKRFQENPANEKPVLRIPVEHLAYKCAENSIGECSNKEQIDDKVTWSKRPIFKPDFSHVEAQEFNLLPIEIDSLFSDKCYQEVGAEFAGYTIDKDALNFLIDRTFKIINPACFESIDAHNTGELVEGVTFKTRYAYSLVKLSALASQDYQPVSYPQEDDTVFGFFTTEKFKVSVDNRSEETGNQIYLNRWNPKKEKVVYYLSENFDKPENKRIKEATFESVAIVNRGLKDAGAGVQIELKDPVKGMNPGDIRNSMIVMVEDPQAISVIGYGPTISNPYSGEILYGRTVMYLGTIKKYIKTTYDEIVEAQRKAKQDAENGEAVKSYISHVVTQPPTAPSVKKARIQAIATKVSQAVGTKASALPSGGSIGHVKLDERFDKKALNQFMRTEFGHTEFEASRRKSLLSQLTEKCAYPAELFNFNDAVAGGIAGSLGGDELKPWEELSQSEREKVIEILTPYVWIPTLIHELGHNLGLRHNFQGSEDVENFYSDAELKGFDIKGPYPYSSVMDYPRSDLNALRAMGKYDVAALRFGYKRQVEVVETNAEGESKTSIVRVASTLKDKQKELKPNQELKNYLYCTDEHVDVNAGCKRFDEGTTFEEIATSMVRQYEDFYWKRNFRKGAFNFSLADESSYADRIDSQFYDLRMFLELVERINARFSPTEEDWNTIPILQDLNKAAQIAENFFLGVAQTPDVHCVLFDNADGSFFVTRLPSDYYSCSDADILEIISSNNWVLLGELGKSFASKKDPHSTNPFADQVDVRGIWIDKLLAMKYLLTRSLDVRNLNSGLENALSRPGMVEKLVDFYAGVLLDEVTAPVSVRFVDGVTIPLTLTYGLADSHVIELPFSESVQNRFGLKQGQSPFLKEILRDVHAFVPDIFHEQQMPFVQAFQVYREAPVGATDATVKTVNGRQFAALPQNAAALLLFDLYDMDKSIAEEQGLPMDEAKYSSLLLNLFEAQSGFGGQ